MPEFGVEFRGRREGNGFLHGLGRGFGLLVARVRPGGQVGIDGLGVRRVGNRRLDGHTLEMLRSGVSDAGAQARQQEKTDDSAHEMVFPARPCLRNRAIRWIFLPGTAWSLILHVRSIPGKNPGWWWTSVP